MGKRLGGARRRTRRTFSKSPRTRGKTTISQYFQTFKKGDKVCLQFDSAVHEGRYFHRYHGNQGKIGIKRGDCYEVLVQVKNNERTLFVHPVHLKRIV